ncbi:MAG TPA: circadian clock protein KaiC [Bacteriovoracaceae bacterium]|nr:circadian clock protein KaiC [Bacteriovoracaceae bacterium]
MSKSFKSKIFDPNQFERSPTGIQGLDEITNGGIPKNRPTLIYGSAGCGKTLFGVSFIVNGATQYNEPGVFLSFEENEEELSRNVASLKVDLPKLVQQKKIVIEHIHLDRSENHETGEYNLEGLFVRLGYAIDSIGAKRVVIDAIETLFSGFDNDYILRSELKRLIRWLKERKVTAIITSESSEDGELTRHGIEEYLSDCVVLLDHRVIRQISTRRIRVIKYRGSTHGTDEFPFLIDKDGISVLPITSLVLKHPGTTERVKTGIPELDIMLSGKGYTRSSSVMISGTAGTGKTSIAGAFAMETCRRGETCLYLSFEESPGQIVANMKSIGMNFDPWIKKGLLQINSTRPGFFGLEMHLLELYKQIKLHKPSTVIIDPLTSLFGQGDTLEIQSILTRMIDLLKMNKITAIFTSLISSKGEIQSEVGVASLIDTWIVVREVEDKLRRRSRGLYIVKSRGMSHSNQIHRLVLSDKGIRLLALEEDTELQLDPEPAKKTKKKSAKKN